MLALNKIDLVDPPRLLPVIDRYASAFSFRAIVPMSALTGDGLDRLEREILAALPEGEPLFPEDYLTDQTERTLAAELIREKVLRTRAMNCRTRRPSSSTSSRSRPRAQA